MFWRPRRMYGIYCRCGDATHPWKVCDVCWRLCSTLEMLESMRSRRWRVRARDAGENALEMLKGMRGGLLCMLEAVEGELCLLEEVEVVEVMRRVRLCMLEAVEGGLCLREVSHTAHHLHYLHL